uniref:Uncharacterized protein n=1 Tax=Anguilla anguilla TaxID=7936 RepID=A0A0E9V054_ANGAN
MILSDKLSFTRQVLPRVL